MVKWLNAHLNVGLPQELYEKIKKHPEVRWCVIARKALVEYLEKIEALEKSESKDAISSLNSET